jgi:UDP-N-acetylmuramoylalanine--D-glutamate ligase
VVELSSHQLEYTHASPDIAVLTNLYPEHLDHYASYDHYVAAKMNILQYQRADGLCVYNADHAELRGLVEAQARGRRLPVSLADADAAGFSDLAERNPRLAGRHNLCDALLAAAVCREVGAAEQAIRTGLDTYRGMPHRMEPIGTYRGIRFVDNAIATVPVATLLAIEALGRADTLIVGGMDRGLDLVPFADAIAESEVRTVVCMPDTGVSIRDRLRAKAAPQRVLWADDMETAVEMCYEYTPAGGICLLSPTASSYNRYKSFEEKGDAFQRLVRIRGERGIT